MAVVNLNDLKPGMRLVKPVFNLHGNLLLKEGMELTKRHLLLFKAWGIIEAEVEGIGREEAVSEEPPAGLETCGRLKNAAPKLQRLDERALTLIDKQLRDKFSDVLQDSVMREIMRVAKKQMAQKAMEL